MNVSFEVEATPLAEANIMLPDSSARSVTRVKRDDRFFSATELEDDCRTPLRRLQGHVYKQLCTLRNGL